MSSDEIWDGAQAVEHQVSLLRERYGADTVLIHKDDRDVELPDSLRLAASLRTCGDPYCYHPEHLTTQALSVYGLIQASLTEWMGDGCPRMD